MEQSQKEQGWRKRLISQPRGLAQTCHRNRVCFRPRLTTPTHQSPPGWPQSPDSPVPLFPYKLDSYWFVHHRFVSEATKQTKALIFIFVFVFVLVDEQATYKQPKFWRCIRAFTNNNWSSYFNSKCYLLNGCDIIKNCYESSLIILMYL